MTAVVDSGITAQQLPRGKVECSYCVANGPAQRVFDSVCGVIERRLRLKVNRDKSAIRHAADVTLLGFGFFLPGPQARIRVAPKAITQLTHQLRVLTRRNWGVSMDYRIGAINRFTTGWMAYFRLADSASTFRDLDGAVKLVAVSWGCQLQMDHYGRVDAASSSLYKGSATRWKSSATACGCITASS